MKELANSLLAVVGLLVSVAVSIVTMIYGWGVSPRSWAIIIGVGLFGQIFAQLFIVVAKLNK